MAIANSCSDVEQIQANQYRATIGAKPRFYQSGGSWRTITNQLGTSGDPSLNIGVNELFDFRIRSALTGNAPVFFIGKGNSQIRMTPLGTNNVSGVVSGNSITYPEAWNNADLRYVIGGHIIRKEVILKSGHPASFSFRVDDKSSNIDDDLIGPDFYGLNPYMENGLSVIPLTWTKSTQGGKRIYTVILPAGDWAGWIIDPTFTSQPDGTSGMDTEIVSVVPNNNYGIFNFCNAGLSSSDYVRGMIKFDISSIPANATINSSSLGMYFSAEIVATDYNVSVRRALTQWHEGNQNGAAPAGGENASTWNYRNTNGSIAWSGAAGGGSGTDYSATPTDTKNIQTLNTVYSWNVASDVQAWVNGTATNYGWWLIGAEANINSLKAFYSSDWTTANQRPVLTIDYTSGIHRHSDYYRRLRQ